MSFKSVPNEDELRKRLNDDWGDYTQKVYAEAGPLMRQYQAIKRKLKGAKTAISFVLIGYGVLPFFTQRIVEEWLIGTVFVVVVVTTFTAIGWAGYTFFKYYHAHNETLLAVNRAIDQLIFQKIFSVFGLAGSLIVPDEKVPESEQRYRNALTISLTPQSYLNTREEQQTMSLLEHSELVTEPRNTVVIDSLFSVTVADAPVFVAELNLAHMRGTGKNRRIKQLFRGYFVCVDLDHTHEGKTFISTEGDEKGFAHKNFWSSLLGHGVLETQLEWNDFEQLLHVATTNGGEARYILTPDFMHDLYEWWKTKKSNIRISFIGNRMYILFPDKDIRLRRTVSKIETQSLQQYAMTIAAPLMHVLHLVEDVNNRFRG